MERVSTYLPMDRRQALAAGRSLPKRAEGAALFADVVGFTRLTDKLVVRLGARRGAEELLRLLNAVHDPLIAQVHRLGGSVVGFNGDGFTCWFDDRGPGPGKGSLRATACGLALQRALQPFASVSIPGGDRVTLSLKVAITAGPVRRLVVGDPQVQRLDLLAGTTLKRLARAEQAATQGEVLVGPEVMQQLGEQLDLAGRRAGFGLVAALHGEVPPAPWPPLDLTALPLEAVRPFLLSPVCQRLIADQGEYLAELRPAVALFQRFAGLDFDEDQAGIQLDAYVRWVQGVLGRYGGYLLQLTCGEKGNYLYVSFGALAVHEDDAQRALAAALELQRLPPDLSFITAIQVGLSRGRVRAGAYGSHTRRTYGAHGDEVNVAARLMQAAPPGELRCSQRIYEATAKAWAFEALPPVEVKGKTGPLQVYRPLGRREEREARLEGPLVGRQAEVAILAQLLERARAGQRWVLLLEGEAGIGKSRLVAELARLARGQGFGWLEGAGQSIEQGTPYRAWRDLLASYFALPPRLEAASIPAERQRRVREQLAGIDPALAERAPLLNDILRLNLPETALTQGFDPKLRRESLTWLVVDLFRDVARRRPLALVLEDAHWLDSLSWELALSVGRALHDCPLLLALAHRRLEAPVPAAYTALAGLEGAEMLHLETMPPDEAVGLAAARLGLPPEALPDEVAGLVRERAGGNPFFAEELALALRDSGALAIKDGSCTLRADMGTLGEKLPDTVEGVVLSRIDRLPPEEQLTLKVAAVVGRSFLYRTVRDVHPRQVIEELLRAYLDDLARRDLTPLEALEPELTYLFKHVITQQVAYDTLLFVQRRELHGAVAGWYERVYAGSLSPYYPLLTHHWRRAEDTTQERHYAQLAGEQAAAQYANAEAVAYLSRALELTAPADLVTRFDLLLAREEVYNLQGKREEQKQDLDTLTELAKAMGEGARQAKVALRYAQYLEVTTDYSAAIAAAQMAADLAKANHDTHCEVASYLQWAQVLARRGDYRAAETQFKQVLALSQTEALRGLEAIGLRHLGSVYWRLGDWLRAADYYQESLRLCREIGDQRSASAAVNNLGLVYWRRGDFALATPYFEQALKIRRIIGDRLGESSTLNNLGGAFYEQGDYDPSRMYAEQALRICREIGDRAGEATALSHLGAIADGEGDYGLGRDLRANAYQIFHELGRRRNEVIELSGLGQIALWQADYTVAKNCLEQGLALCQEIEDGQLEPDLHMALATLSYSMGDYRQAKVLGERALQAVQQTGNRIDLSGILIVLGLVACQEGDVQLTRQHCQQALDLLRDIGAPGSQARALTCLGHALAKVGEIDPAVDTYLQAVKIRRERGPTHLAMEPLAGLARVALSQGDLVLARTHVREILALLQDRTPDGADEPLRIHLTCYHVLHASGDPNAEAILEVAHRLLRERAVKIEDEELRRSYLEDIAAHREIVAAYQAAAQ